MSAARERALQILSEARVAMSSREVYKASTQWPEDPNVVATVLDALVRDGKIESSKDGYYWVPGAMRHTKRPPANKDIARRQVHIARLKTKIRLLMKLEQILSEDIAEELGQIREYLEMHL